jgi:putative peptidoglycan lipid II flippase
VLQVVTASLLMGVGLFWAANHWDWTGLQSQAWLRIALMAGVLAISGVVYLVTLRVIGVDLRALLRR